VEEARTLFKDLSISMGLDDLARSKSNVGSAMAALEQEETMAWVSRRPSVSQQQLQQQQVQQ
jgi:hypothetical protein